MPSTAWPPMRPIPIPAPMTARPAPRPAPMKPSPRLLLAVSAATWSNAYMVMEFSERYEDRTAISSAPSGAARHRDPGLNEHLRPFGRIQPLALERVRAGGETTISCRLSALIPASRFPRLVTALADQADEHAREQREDVGLQKGDEQLEHHDQDRHDERRA